MADNRESNRYVAAAVPAQLRLSNKNCHKNEETTDDRRAASETEKKSHIADIMFVQLFK